MDAVAARDLRDLIERCRGLRYDVLPERTRATAHHSLLDWLGCAVAGAVDAAATIVDAAMASAAGGASRVLGTDERSSWRDAIVRNGVRGHALDFDDMLPDVQGHPSAAVFPALVVLGEERGSSVADVLTAYVAGVEVAAWIAGRIMPEHYDAGWHGTATLGTLAAAAASAHLLGLDADGWVTSLDVAATQAAGMRALFGTVAKPLHAGRAAEAGALAARLAAAGASSTGRGLLGGQGFVALYGAGKADITVGAGHPFAVDGTLYKAYASCYMTQSVIDAAIELRTALPLSDITGLTITASPKLRDVCAIEDPRTANEAKFSLHATTALALLGHDLSHEAALVPENLRDSAYRSLRERITLVFDDAFAGHEPRVRVTVSTPDGADVVLERDRGVPERDLDARGAALARKAEGLIAPVLGVAAATALVALAGRDDAAVADVLEAAAME